MITILFRMKMKNGKEEPALASLRMMAETVSASEPDTLAYVFHRSQEDPADVVLYEAYPDEAALQAHVRSPHMADFQTSIAELFDTSAIKVDALKRIAGFVRAG
ncbi:MAG: antibiotic biosynthesis monooxygenase [Chloroflexi bacterium]|nr:antibiotic biosynthesis monooxygenase [Chloroflexota bacterium]